LTWTSKPLVGGFSPTPDDEIPNIWKNNPNVPNHQPEIHMMIPLTNHHSSEVTVRSYNLNRFVDEKK
jgi:hypothetical protein